MFKKTKLYVFHVNILRPTYLHQACGMQNANIKGQKINLKYSWYCGQSPQISTYLVFSMLESAN